MRKFYKINQMKSYENYFVVTSNIGYHFFKLTKGVCTREMA